MESLSEIIFSKIISFKKYFIKILIVLITTFFLYEDFKFLNSNNLSDILLKNRLYLIQLIVDLTKNCL